MEIYIQCINGLLVNASRTKTIRKMQSCTIRSVGSVHFLNVLHNTKNLHIFPCLLIAWPETALSQIRKYRHIVSCLERSFTFRITSLYPTFPAVKPPVENVLKTRGVRFLLIVRLAFIHRIRESFVQQDPALQWKLFCSVEVYGRYDKILNTSSFG